MNIQMIGAFFSNKIVQAGIGLATLLILVGQAYDYAYDKGVHDARIEIQAEHNRLLEEKREEYDRQVNRALSIISEDTRAEMNRLRKLAESEDKADEIIELIKTRIVVSPDCAPLADNVVGVLSEATNIVIGREREAEDSNQ